MSFETDLKETLESDSKYIFHLAASLRVFPSHSNLSLSFTQYFPSDPPLRVTYPESALSIVNFSSSPIFP